MNLQDSRAGANGYAIQLTAVDAAGLPSLCELLGGDVQAAWAQACVEILASVCDPTRAFDGKRSIKMTISFVPEPDLQSCQYFIEPLSIEIPAPDVPRGGRMVFRRNDKGMTARLKSGIREAMPELPEVRRINRSSVVEALQLDALGEGYLDMAWCSDWRRVTGDSVLLGAQSSNFMTGVFLDPPYPAGRTSNLYSTDSLEVWDEVRLWALEHGDNPRLRIALCGYEGPEMPGWREHAWKTSGGYGNQGAGTGRANADRERIWFSPACLDPNADHRQQEGREQATLWSAA